jgi:hypothetical protein
MEATIVLSKARVIKFGCLSAGTAFRMKDSQDVMLKLQSLVEAGVEFEGEVINACRLSDGELEFISNEEPVVRLCQVQDALFEDRGA